MEGVGGEKEGCRGEREGGGEKERVRDGGGEGELEGSLIYIFHHCK